MTQEFTIHQASTQPSSLCLLPAELLRQGLYLAVAESCTGGLLSAELTAIPGATGWFQGGVVAYANTVKQDMLDVPEALLVRYGAVSAETAAAMALGVRRRCRADIGLSITGIAGPGGATPDKPVGLVFVGLSDRRGEQVISLTLEGSRDDIRQSACHQALDALLGRLHE